MSANDKILQVFSWLFLNSQRWISC